MTSAVYNKTESAALLYKVVFGYSRLRLMVVCMLGFFLLNPVVPAFANETEVSEEETAETAADESEEPEPVPSTEPATTVTSADDQDASDELVTTEMATQAVAAEATLEAAVGATVSTTEEMPESDASETIASYTEENTTSDGQATPQATSEEDASSTGEVVRSTSTITATTTEIDTAGATTPPTSSDGSTSNDQDTEVASTTESEVPLSDESSGAEESAEQEVRGETPVDKDAVATSSAATSSSPGITTVRMESEMGHSNTHYQFDRQSCIAMGDGAYHCFEADSKEVPTDMDGTYAYAIPDSDGDNEIYLITNGDAEMITDNEYEDVAPHYDPVSESVVWQRELEGRFKVFTYEDGEETLLSEGFTSSMEPDRNGTYTVWQSWVGADWEVILHDGTEAVNISNQTGQDVAPHVQGDFVIWNTIFEDTKVVSVYQISTGMYSTIEDGDGARVENPRFVLVYDTKFENGDVITKGYDAASGEVVPLAAQGPSDLPNIPDSDQTGEKSAIIQNKSSREDQDGTFEPDHTPHPSSGSPADSQATSSSAATSSSHTVAVTPAATNVNSSNDAEIDTTTATTSSSVVDELPLTDFDIIVESLTEASSTQSVHSSST